MNLQSDEAVLSTDLMSYFYSENLRRLRVFGTVLMIVELAGMFNDLINPSYKILLPVHLGIISTFVIGLSLISLTRNSTVHRIIYYAMLWLTLISTTTMTLLDQSIHGQISVYVQGVMGIAALFYMPVQISIPMFLSVYALFLFGMIKVQQNSDLLFAALFNGTISIVFAWVVSFFMHKTKVTEFALRQKQRLHEERLLTLGTLVSVASHEINTPNNALLLSVQAQQHIWNELRPVHEAYARENGDFEVGGYTYGELKNEMPLLLDRAMRNSQRIKKIVQDLRGFSRKQEEALDENVQINGVVTNSLSLVDNLLKKKTKNLCVRLGENIPRIRGNHQRLEQVVINLLHNAAQALESPEKGIILSTSYDEPKAVVTLTVKDEGKGIEKKDLEHIFDPFFTTKDTEEGTGLGLSICRRIITSHKGDIAIASEPGMGTCVSIYLPVHGA